MAASSLTPIGAVGRGVFAAAAATGVMTAAQTAYYKATGIEGSTTPGEVARRIIEGVLKREVSDEQVVGPLNQGMHWLYGTSWGVPYGIAAGSRADGSLLRSGLALGLGVWSASRAEMTAMQIVPPPWQDPPLSLAMDVGFHLVYGLAGAAVFRALR